jgi:septum formation topological specificity factor MinE
VERKLKGKQKLNPSMKEDVVDKIVKHVKMEVEVETVRNDLPVTDMTVWIV